MGAIDAGARTITIRSERRSSVKQSASPLLGPHDSRRFYRAGDREFGLQGFAMRRGNGQFDLPFDVARSESSPVPSPVLNRTRHPCLLFPSGLDSIRLT